MKPWSVASLTPGASSSPPQQLGSANVLSTTLRQIVIPATQLARTTGAYRQFMFGSIPLGNALGGILGGSLGSRTRVALGTLGLAVSALPMLARSIRSLRDPHDARGPGPAPAPATREAY